MSKQAQQLIFLAVTTMQLIFGQTNVGMQKQQANCHHTLFIYGTRRFCDVHHLRIIMRIESLSEYCKDQSQRQFYRRL